MAMMIWYILQYGLVEQIFPALISFYSVQV